MEEALETGLVYSVMGLNPPDRPFSMTRPFRAPHHTISSVGLIGGGPHPRPGEISLAHHGVLFLDELPEFSRDVLEALRQPLEEGRITVSRAQGRVDLPARFMLVASMNPCPCGFAGDPTKGCRCTPAHIHRYRSKVSGPLLDRIDIHLEVPAVSVADLMAEAQGESSQAIRHRVTFARAQQRQRFQTEGIFCNAQMKHRHLKRFARLGTEEKELLKQAVKTLGLSARAYDRILKVAQTIADLAGSDQIRIEHLAEAIQYRSLDRFTWG